MTNEQNITTCPKCGNSNLLDKYCGIDSYDSYAVPVLVCEECDLWFNTWNDTWYIDWYLDEEYE